jgi:hypothetical protein
MEGYLSVSQNKKCTCVLTRAVALLEIYTTDIFVEMYVCSVLFMVTKD